MKAKNYVCFSVFKYSDNERAQFKTYRVGIEENVKLCAKFYPDFTPLVFISEDLIELQEKLEALGAKTVIKNSQPAGWIPMHWRCIPLIEGNFNTCLFRDADSRISIREKNLVKKFLSSSFNFHSIRDNLHHTKKIMGGMWGAKKTSPEIARVISKCFEQNPVYGFDERVFENDLWDLIKDDCLVHDSSIDSSDFIENPDKSFIGQPFRYAGE